jgi:hypothetical protein
MRHLLFGLAFNDVYDYQTNGKLNYWLKNNGNNQLNLYKNLDLVPPNYFHFCIVRDPVERFISGYQNRVLKLGQLNLHISSKNKFIEAGLSLDPEINEFVEHLQDYFLNPDIYWHFRPVSEFFDDYVYRFRFYFLDEIDRLYAELSTHFKQNNLRNFGGGSGDLSSFAAMPRRNKSAKQLDQGILTIQSIEKLHDFYEADYKLFQSLGLKSTFSYL